MDDLQARTVRAAIWSVLQQLVSRTLSFAVFAVLARLLVPDHFGVVAIAAAIQALLEMLVEQGVATTITQRKDLEPELVDTAFWLNLGTGLLLAAGFAAAAPLIADGFEAPLLAQLIPWMALGLVVRGASGIHEGLLRRELAFRRLAMRTIVASVIGGVAGIAAAVAGAGAWALVIQQLVAAGAGAIVLWTSSPWRPRLRFSHPHARQLYGFSGYLLGASALDFVNRRTDDFLIGYYLGTGLLGVYAVAYRVLLVMTQLLTSSLSSVALSAFSRLQAEPRRLVDALHQGLRMSSLVTFPVFAGTALVAPELVVVVFGPQWHASAPVLQVLAFVGLLHSVTYYFGATYVALGRPDVRLKLLVIHTGANVAGFVISVRWGIVAVALAYTVRAYLLLPLDLFALRQLVGLPFRRTLAVLAPATVCTGVMSAGVLAVRHLLDGASPLVALVVASATGALVYAVSLILLFPARAQALLARVRKRGRTARPEAP